MLPPNVSETAPSTSKDLVPAGSRHVSSGGHSRSSGRDADQQKPSTARALVLRNGKHGVRGTQEVMLLGRMSGREKLELLAEDLMKKAKTALGAKFNFEQCLKIADSQLNASLDEIEALHDPDLFADEIEAEIEARSHHTDRDSLKHDANHVASVVGSKIHNEYMLASAWRLIQNTLRDLQKQGLNDITIRNELKLQPRLRSQFVVLYDLVTILSQVYQSRFALLATSSEHYGPFFKQINVEGGGPEYVFDWSSLRNVHKSFLDSIIIELCLPQSSIPDNILYRVLEEAIEESPRDAKLFPQGLWDAVGDLRVIVQLQELVESPLLGPDRKGWLSPDRKMPEEFEQWVYAQHLSEHASKEHSDFKHIIHPLDKTSDGKLLESMWQNINYDYEKITGATIDELWELTDVLHRIPQWHGQELDVDSDNDSDVPQALVPVKHKREGTAVAGGRRLAIENGDGNETDDSLPPLQSRSGTSDDDLGSLYDDLSESDESEWDDAAHESESAYDTDEEQEMRNMLREAMDTAHADPNFLDPKGDAHTFHALAEENEDNPFLKLLGSLRGRSFSASPTLKSTLRTEQRRPYTVAQDVAAGPSARGEISGKPVISTGSSTPAVDTRTTVEDADDEEGTTTAVKKKKKKKPKKKKSAGAKVDAATIPPAEIVTAADVPASSIPPTPAVVPENPKQSPSKNVQPKKQATQKPVEPTQSRASTSSTLPFIPAASLPLPQEQTARSARSYLQSEGGATAGKTKVKKRPDFATTFLPIPEKKKGIFGKSKADKRTAEEKDDDKTDAKPGIFSRLSNKGKALIRQVIGTSDDVKKGSAGMKWESFLRVMREMGFSYDPSTAGSSVRFDPPNPKDSPISIHKPHPDSKIPPVKLKRYGKRLKQYYGWSEEVFQKALEEDEAEAEE